MPDPVIPPNDPGAVTPWTSHASITGLDAEMNGYIANRGWDKLGPEAAAFEAAKAHREASRSLGIDPSRIVRLPENLADSAAMRAVWERFGAPKEAGEYKFEGLPEGLAPELTTRLTDGLRTLAHELGMPAEWAGKVAQFVTGQFKGEADAATTIRQGAETKSAEALKSLWGANMDANQLVAKNAAAFVAGKMGERGAALGSALTEFEGKVGSETIMEMFRLIGVALGEDKHVRDPSGQGDGAMTRDQAVAKRAELENDKAWADRYRKGDTQAREQLGALLRIITAD